MTEKGNECTERGVGIGSGRFRSLEIVNSAVCEPMGEREVYSHGCVARDAGGGRGAKEGQKTKKGKESAEKRFEGGSDRSRS